MNEVEKICLKAKEQRLYVQSLSVEDKNKMLEIMAQSLIEHSGEILAGNETDLKENADKPKHFLDRLMLNEKRILDIAEGLRVLINLPDPVGEIIETRTVKSGLKISRVRVPLGVIGIIYEARPNVTVDVVGLCLKSGNCAVLRGSKDAINSNKTLISILKASLKENGYNPEFIQLICDTTREGAEMLMKARGFVDVLIPRGSANLIKTVVEKSSVPVIETGSGNCHAYVEKTADFDMAKDIIINGKTSRPSVCNALESLVVDEKIAAEFIPFIYENFKSYGVEVVGCDKAVKVCPAIGLAAEEDFFTEYEALKISIKVVSGLDEAINHINKHSTSHSEVIITKDEKAARKFLNDIDSAAVYVNASTRFTDGFEFGYGAEMGISTQKIHARGPMGLKELTSYKYQVTGEGQIR